MNIGADLRKAIKGQVLVSGDAGFAEAARPWNVAIQQPVQAVVTAEDADDVAEVVRQAGLNGLTVTPQPSGHGASGDVEGLILLRTRKLDDVEVRPAERIARVGAGAQWGEVLAATSPHGLTGLAGSSAVVSVTGYTLGGGLSWFGRRYGWASDSVRAFEVVTADGTQARVTADTDAELFWALRGGGGDYAIVTGLEFDLHPAPSLYGGKIMWPAERTAEVLAAYREVTATAPDELTVWFERVNFPDLPVLPEFLRGLSAVTVDTTFLGDGAQAQELIRAFTKIDGALSDTHAALPVAELASVTAEPTDPAPGLGRTELLTEFADTAADKLLAERIEPLLFMQLRHLGGALARPVDGGGAAAPMSEQHLLYLFGIPATPDLAAALRTRQGEIAEALAPYTSGRKPFTFLAPGERAGAAFSAAALARLQETKRGRDPRNVIRANYPVLG